MKPPGKPLFIPLHAGPYDSFASGAKCFELRLHGPRWNVRTCYPGRAVILSRGYGKKYRMAGRVVSFAVVYASALTPEMLGAFIACYGEGKRQAEIALIGIEADP